MTLIDLAQRHGALQAACLARGPIADPLPPLPDLPRSSLKLTLPARPGSGVGLRSTITLEPLSNHSVPISVAKKAWPNGNLPEKLSK
jgi:hypothetical protein